MALELRVDFPNRDVQPYYYITGAKPGAPLYWSSFRNGRTTGEWLQFYGHIADTNGNWCGWGDKFIESGEWFKRVQTRYVCGAEWTWETGNTHFIVRPWSIPNRAISIASYDVMAEFYSAVH